MPFFSRVLPRLLLALALTLNFCATAPGATPVSPAAPAPVDFAKKSRQVDALFADYDSRNTPGCAVGVIYKGEYVHEKGYGMANLEQDIAITPRTKMRLDSMSKQFTAASMVLLADQKRVSLDDDIRKYLPELPDYGDVVTIRNLLMHRSGLHEYDEIGVEWEEWPDYYHDYEEFFKKDPWVHREQFFPISSYLKKIAAIKQLKFKPGSKFEYNNPGYFLLGQIIERITGQTLRQFADANIFRPLGMADSLYNDRVLEPLHNRADGYLPLPDGRFLVFNTNLDIVGEGGVFTTLYDFLLWDENFYHNALGGPNSQLIPLLTKPNLKEGDVGYGEAGFGLRVSKMNGGLMAQYHGGGYVGIKTFAIRFPEKRFSVVLLCNRYDVDAKARTLQVADVYLPDL